MDFYLLGPPDLRLPVNPAEVQVEASGKTETLSLVNLGDVEIPVGRQPAGISLSSFFPRDYDPGYCRYADIPEPAEALRVLVAWRDSGRPVRFLVTETSINLLVFVAKISYRFAGGEPGDLYYDLGLREWRDLRVRQVAAATTASAQGSATAAAARPDTKRPPKVYTVRLGDTLYGIAKLELGNGARWREIYDLNKTVIGPDPNLILPGQRLVMPA